MFFTTPSQRTDLEEPRRIHSSWLGDTKPRTSRHPAGVNRVRSRQRPRDQDRVEFRVEFHTAERAIVLCQGVTCSPHHTALTPFATHLRLAGATAGGWLVLVHPEGDTVVARRYVSSTGGTAPGV